MYSECKNVDVDIVQISLNAKKFGVESLVNQEILSHFLRGLSFEISSQNLDALEKIFKGLDEIKLQNQMSNT